MGRVDSTNVCNFIDGRIFYACDSNFLFNKLEYDSYQLNNLKKTW